MESLKITRFKAKKKYFKKGDFVVLTWETTGADIVEIVPFGKFNIKGEQRFRIDSDERFFKITIIAMQNKLHENVQKTILLENKQFHPIINTEKQAVSKKLLRIKKTTNQKVSYLSFLNPKGRISQRTFALLSSILIVIFALLLGITSNSEYYDFLFLYIFLIFIVIIFILSIKRFHDLDKTGKFVLLYFVPFLGPFLWMFLVFSQGKTTINKYGDVPTEILNPDDIPKPVKIFFRIISYAKWF